LRGPIGISVPKNAMIMAQWCPGLNLKADSRKAILIGLVV